MGAARKQQLRVTNGGASSYTNLATTTAAFLTPSPTPALYRGWPQERDCQYLRTTSTTRMSSTRALPPFHRSDNGNRVSSKNSPLTLLRFEFSTTSSSSSSSSTSLEGESTGGTIMTTTTERQNNAAREKKEKSNQEQSAYTTSSTAAASTTTTTKKKKKTSSSSNLPIDPYGPLKSILSKNIDDENNNNNNNNDVDDDDDYLAQYTLPQTILGRDDYRTTLKPNTRIVAFGDVHGDIDALRSFLITAMILDPTSSNDEPLWCGGNTICVQTGDVLDRGDDELACFRLLATLSRQAHMAGGALLLLYGNHESLNAAGLFQYANVQGNAEFECDVGTRIDYNLRSNRWRLQFAGNEPSRWATLEPGGLLCENLLSNMMVACVVGRTVFVHAGLTANHLRVVKDSGIGEGGVAAAVGGGGGGEYKKNGITRLNEQAREWILKTHHGNNNNYGEYDTVEDVIAAAQNRAKVASKTMPDCLGGGVGAASPVWMRDYSQPNDREPKNIAKTSVMISDALLASGPDVRRMVMGHTPQRQINSALGGRAWRIDVGASKGVMGGTPEVLEIIHMGGEDGEDVINILTVNGDRVSGTERSVSKDDNAIMDFFDMRR